MMTFLQTNGLKVICWMAPFVNNRSDDEGVRGQNLGQAEPAGMKPSFSSALRRVVLRWSFPGGKGKAVRSTSRTRGARTGSPIACATW